jgi:hypothetical protein
MMEKTLKWLVPMAINTTWYCTSNEWFKIFSFIIYSIIILTYVCFLARFNGTSVLEASCGLVNGQNQGKQGNMSKFLDILFVKKKFLTHDIPITNRAIQDRAGWKRTRSTGRYRDTLPR